MVEMLSSRTRQIQLRGHFANTYSSNKVLSMRNDHRHMAIMLLC